jgi:hypothetical protein
MISLKIDVKRFTWLLVIVYLILLILNIVVVFLRHKFMTDSGAVEQLDRYFNFATEVNLPTFFNAVLIFMGGQTFYIIASNITDKIYLRRYWFLMAFIFFFLSIDEFIQIHEWFSSGLPRKFGIGGEGIFKFAWIIPYGIAALIFGLYSLKVLKTLDRKDFLGYALAGGLYLLGVIVMEALGGKFVEMNNDVETLEYYLFFTTIEESLEMIAMILLLNVNLRIITR